MRVNESWTIGTDAFAQFGAGVALAGARLSGHAEIAMPLTHADAEGWRSASVFAELSYRF